MTPPTKIPKEFDTLPEPGRAKAYEFFQELVQEGMARGEAIQEALKRGQSWIAERVRSAS